MGKFFTESEWRLQLSDGQGPARRQEAGARPGQVQVPLPGHRDHKSGLLHAFAAQDDTEDLETTDKFKLAVVQNKLLGPVVYR